MEKKSPESAKKSEPKPKRHSDFSHDGVSQQESQYLTRCTRFRLSTEYELSICNCKHILRMTIGERHSVVNPQRWLCNTCFTTESVWACLSCPNVACGRYIHEHALNHFQESGHPLVIDVNELYVYCYACEEYVLNDNKSGDIKVLRETLQAIRYQNFTGTTRSGHTLRTATISADEDVQMRRRMQQQQLDRDDRLFTAIWHSRFVRQRKTFRNWLHYVRNKDKFIASDDESDSKPVVDSQSHRAQIQEDFIGKLDKCLPEAVDLTLRPQENVSKLQSSMCATNQNPFEMVEDLGIVKQEKTSSHGLMDKLPELYSASTLSSNSQMTQTDFKESLPCTNSTVENSDKANIKTDVIILLTDQLSEEEPLKDLPVVGAADSCEKTEPFQQIAGSQMSDEKCQLAENKTDSLLETPKRRKVSSEMSPVVSSRPKRANAASRYKEIMTRLSQSVEPPKKKPCLVEKSPEAPPEAKEISEKQSVRRSLRLQIREETAAKKRRRQIKNKKRSLTPTIRKKKKSNTTVQKLIIPPRSRIYRRVTSESGSKSLYDSVPNRAVTSLIPGVTGLRNLGNTCYLNSIIQVLGHLQKFRRCLLAVRDLDMDESTVCHDDHQVSPSSKFRIAGRRSTIEMYENQSTTASKRLLKMQAGLNGGQESGNNSPQTEVGTLFRQQQLCSTSSQNPLSLCHELHDLYHIMWSGKWKLVSPYHFLSSVWQLIPSFRGYSQQDAQEFLCELLDKIVSELERRHVAPRNPSSRLSARISRVVHTVFEGRLHSKVRCLQCNQVSSTIEPFWDLSLEFPQRYHTSNWKNHNKACSLQEMLDKFTEAEKLDGGCVYSCANCNDARQGGVGGRRARGRRLSHRKLQSKLTEAEKQIKITELPQILRFHLKRFRWSGRNHREKITVPVNFPSELDMKQHCWVSNEQPSVASSSQEFMYDLSAVVIHHGRGFGSGHYTAYCWNDVGKFWVHCNDSNLELCSIDDVMESQAYILFYTQRGLDPHPHLFTPPPTPGELSPLPSPADSPNPA